MCKVKTKAEKHLCIGKSLGKRKSSICKRKANYRNIIRVIITCIFTSTSHRPAQRQITSIKQLAASSRWEVNINIKLLWYGFSVFPRGTGEVRATQGKFPGDSLRGLYKFYGRATPRAATAAGFKFLDWVVGEYFCIVYTVFCQN